MEFSCFKHKTVDFKKLIEFGFTQIGQRYDYVTQIVDGQFEMAVSISEHGEVETRVIDLATDEPYTLHLVAEACGTFVGQVRTEFERVLQAIADSCFYRDVFKEDIAHGVIEYVRNTYGDELEFLWDKVPDGAIWRRKDNRKWYGIMMIISKRKLGFDSDEMVSVIDLRLDTVNDASLVDGKRYFAGYHMNKRTWFTMCLDGSVSLGEICALIDKSYVLAYTKKK